MDLKFGPKPAHVDDTLDGSNCLGGTEPPIIQFRLTGLNIIPDKNIRKIFLLNLFMNYFKYKFP